MVEEDLAKKAKVAKIGQRAYELGKKYHQVYRGYGQSLIAAVFDALGVENDAVFKAATGFASGTGVMGDTGCGCLSGGTMVLCTFRGRERSDFIDSANVRWDSYRLARELQDKFIQEYGTSICREIQRKIMGRPFLLSDPDDMKKFEEAGGHTTVCPEVVGKAARWIIEIPDKEGLIPESSLAD